MNYVKDTASHIPKNGGKIAKPLEWGSCLQFSVEEKKKEMIKESAIFADPITDKEASDRQLACSRATRAHVDKAFKKKKDKKNNVSE
jgi:hypothetical protein